MDENTIQVKVVIIGDSTVGKTAIATRFTKGVFNNSILPTISDVFKYQMKIDNKQVTLSIYDTAGQETFKSITKKYYRDASIVIIVFAVGDIDNNIPKSETSYRSIGSWYNDVLEQNNNNNAIISLCGNMTDISDRKISHDDGQNLADRLSIPYFETSAKNGEGIQNLFEENVKLYLQNVLSIKSKSSDQQLENIVKLDEESSLIERRCC